MVADNLKIDPNLFDPSLFTNKEYLLNDLKYCLIYADDLRSKAKEISTNGQVPDDVQQWLKKREALQEKIQKILINAKEEWRSVLLIVPSLMEICLDVLERCKPKQPLFDMALDILRCVSLCINPKRIGRYWPTDVQWLLKVTDWLEDYLHSYSFEDFTSTNILVLWLSSAVRTPFDLSRFDNQSQKQIPIAERIASGIIEANMDNYSLNPVMHLLAGSFYSRPDCYKRLSKFIGKLFDKIVTTGESSQINEKLCCFRIMASLLKKVDRTVMLEHVDGIFKIISQSIEQEHEQLVKLAMKICGRCALVHLKPSEQFKWKYRCGKRVNQLIDNKNDQLSLDSNLISNNDVKEIENEDLPDLPDYFEELIQILLTNLVHKHTVVRFSVAKYLAAIGHRLPLEFAHEILENIFILCSPMEDDNYWHGSCLAIAEFVRRGQVRIDSLPRVVNILNTRALFFEQIKGSFSSGANVRDAACYICWSLARAYEGSMIAGFVTDLAPKLLNVACLDPNVNCRRAASAVIQELAGRTQQFPNWIDVIPRLELHELSQIEHTYLNLSVHFAVTYPEFRESIVRNLLFEKCSYWDPAIRRLASKTIGKIASKCPFLQESYFKEFFDDFKTSFESVDLNHRHGWIMAISYLLYEDKSLSENQEVIETTFEIFSKQSRTLKTMSLSFGTNLIRESLLIFVEKCFPLLPKDSEKKVYSFLLDSIQSNDSNELIQVRTIEALKCFISQIQDRNLVNEYICQLIELIIPPAKEHQHFIVSTMVQFITTYNQLSEIVYEKTVDQILIILDGFLDRWFDKETRRPETIADVSSAILCLTTIKSSLESSSVMEKVHKNLLRCLDDHSITKKGNTGLPVRTACIESIYNYCSQLKNQEKLLQIIRLISTEAASYRKRTFILAIMQLAKISAEILPQHSIFNDENFDSLKQLPIGLPWKENIETIDNEKLDLDDLYRRCLKLFECPQLTKDLWPGFLKVLADPIMNKHSKMITDYIQNSVKKEEILNAFEQVAMERAKCPRLSLPLLTSGHLLLTRVTTGKLFQEQMARFAWLACEKTSIPSKYLLACDIFCALLCLGQIKLTIGYIYVLLGHRLPRVRHYTSVQLYTAILSLDFGDDHGDDHNNTMTLDDDEIGLILQQTNWSDLNESKRERERVRNLLKTKASKYEQC